MADAAQFACGQAAAPAADGPINVTFVIHFDPLPAPGGQVLRRGYEAERDNLRWLAELLERIEREKGLQFVPRLALEIAGDHAEYYREDKEGFELLQRLYGKGIHTFGVHFHRNYKVGPHRWVSVPFGAPWARRAARRITEDHIAEVDRLIGQLIGSDEPQRIRQVNHTITGHLVDQQLAARMGFDLHTGGRNETLNLFFDHDVYNPYRPALGWPLAEDPDSRWLLIPQSPVLGRIGEHAPIPRGVAEEYRQASRRGMIWQDLSVPAMRRKFLHVVLEWREHRHAGQQKLWVFGWHEHTNDLFPPDRLRWKPSQRQALAEFVGWLNTHFIGRRTADGRLIARYANTDQVRDAFLAWEEAHPGQSSFSYAARDRDWQRYPYRLKGLARELMYSHHEEELTEWLPRGVHVHRLVRTDGQHWAERSGRIVCTGKTETIYLVWSDRGEVTVDLSKLLAGPVQVVRGRSGERTTADAGRLTVGEEPIIVRAAPAQAAQSRHEPPVLVQFRMNCNYFPDEAAARRNCENLRWHLQLMKRLGLKASYWFTALAAEQVQRIDPELIELIKRSGMPVGHHGANRPPRPQPIDRVRGEDWQQDVQAILDYESYRLDPQTGRLDRSRPGGLKWMQQLFDGRIQATGRFFEASILYAEKQLGCRAMIGLRDNVGASTNAAWFLGMKNLPDAFSIGPGQLRAAALGRLDLERYVESYLRDRPRAEGGSIAILIHDHDFLRGPPPLCRRLRETYEDLAAWIARHPRLKAVTFEDILQRVIDDRTKTVRRDALIRAAEAVAASAAAPPDYIDLGGDYLSLADTFQAFAFALCAYARTGQLPDTVTAHDMLGPTRYRAEERPERGSLPYAQDVAALRRQGRFTTDPARIPTTPRSQKVDIRISGEQVIDTARSLELSDRVPWQIELPDSEVNPAVFLHLMAQTINNIARPGQPGTVRLHGPFNVLPRSVQKNQLADGLTKLQFWTYKRSRSRRGSRRAGSRAVYGLKPNHCGSAGASPSRVAHPCPAVGGRGRGAGSPV